MKLAALAVCALASTMSFEPQQQPGGIQLICRGCSLRPVIKVWHSCVVITVTEFGGQSGHCIPINNNCHEDDCLIDLEASVQNNCQLPLYIKESDGSGCTDHGSVGSGSSFAISEHGTLQCGKTKIFRFYGTSPTGCGVGGASAQIGFICQACQPQSASR